jgi:hypothetical protein
MDRVRESVAAALDPRVNVDRLPLRPKLVRCKLDVRRHRAAEAKIAQERVAPCRGRGRGRRNAAAWPASPGAGWPSPHWPGARSVTSLSGFAPLGRPSPPSSLLAISSKYLKLSSDRTYSVGPCRPCSCGPPFPSRVVEGKTRGRPGARGKDRHGDSRRTGVTGVPMRAA